MARFLCNDSQEAVSSVIKETCHLLGYFHEEDETNIYIKDLSGRYNPSLTIELAPYPENESKTEMQVTYALSPRVVKFIFFLNIALISLLASLLYKVGTEFIYNMASNPLSNTVDFFCSGALVVIYTKVRLYLTKQSDPKEFIQCIHQGLEENFRLTQLEPLQYNFSECDRRFWDFSLFSWLFVVSKLILLFLLFGFWGGIIGYLIFHGTSLQEMCCKRFSGQWRGHYFRLYEPFSSSFNLLLLMFTVWLSMTALFFTLIVAEQPELRQQPIWNDLVAKHPIGFVTHFIHGSYRDDLNPTGLTEELIKITAANSLLDAGREKPSIMGQFTGLFRTFSVVYLLFFIGMMLYSISDHLRRFRRGRNKELVTDETGASLVQPTPDSPLFGFRDRLLLTAYLSIMALYHWASVALALDLTLYAISGKMILFPMLSVMYELMKAQTMLIADSSLVLFYFRLMVSLMMLPGFFLLLIMFRRIVFWIVYEQEITRSQSKIGLNGLDKESRTFVEELCSTLGIRKVSVTVSIEKPFVMYAESSTLGLGHRIVIGNEILEQFPISQQKALLAHELHHLVEDSPWIARYKLISLLLLFPFNYAMLLYDYARQEEKADRFAMQQVGQQELAQAVSELYYKNRYRKASTQLTERPNGRLFHFWNLLTCFHDDSILGASYPLFQNRMKYLTEGLDENAE